MPKIELNTASFNLYKILVQHTAPKEHFKSMVEYVIACNDEDMYNYIDNEHNYNAWEDRCEYEVDGSEERRRVYDDNYTCVGTIPHKEYIISSRGEMFDEDYDYSDAFYGITLYGWELVQENINVATLQHVINMGVIKNIEL